MFESKRRTHSTIDLLPKELVDALRGMVVDNEWPDDYQGEKIGKPSYADMQRYVAQKGGAISVAAIGRFARRMRTISQMSAAALQVRDVMNSLSGEKVSATQKAAAEMLTAHILEYLTGNSELTSEDIRDVALALKTSTSVVLKADEYMRLRLAEKSAAMKHDVGAIKPKKMISRETLQTIREQVYGIIDHHLGINQQASKEAV